MIVPPLGVGRVFNQAAAIVGVVVPPSWASFAECDFCGMDFLAGNCESSVAAGTFGDGNFAAGAHQFIDQALASFFIEIWIGAAPESFFVNEVPTIWSSRIFQFGRPLVRANPKTDLTHAGQAVKKQVEWFASNGSVPRFGLARRRL